MSAGASAAAVALAAGAAVACGFTAVALAATARDLRAARKVADPAAWPGVVVLRPCEGDEPELLARLRSTLEAVYPGALRLVVAHGGDPRAFADLAGDPRVTLVRSPSPPDAGVNRKAWHLRSALAAVVADPALDAPAWPLVLAIDADVEVTGDLLRGLARAACGDGVSAAFGAPVQGGDRAASRLGHAALGGSPHAFAVLAALARVAGGVAPMVGCAVAYRRDALLAAGGFDPALHVIGDDLALGDALAARGRVVLAPALVDCRNPALTPRGLLAQLARWIRVAAAHRPRLWPTYPTLIAPLPLVALLALLAARDAGALAFAPVALLYALRVALAGVLRAWIYGEPRRALWDPLLADAAWCAAWCAALAPGKLLWRGRAYVVGPGGRLVANGGAR